MKHKSFIVDADVHHAYRHPSDLLPYMTRVWHDQWLEMGNGIYRQYYSPVGVARDDSFPEGGGGPGSDPALMRQQLLDAYGIDYAILSTGIEISLNPDPDYATAVASAYNDYTIEHWLTASPKFRSSILINNTDPAAAAREIDRLGSHPGMVQVIMTSASRMLYGQRFYHPIYEAAERNGLPIAIHPGGEGRGIAPAVTNAGYPTRYFEWHNIVPISYMSHVNSMVCEGVFERFPGLKLICIEGGISWLPHLMWRMDKNYKALRDTVPWLKRLPSEYILHHVYLTTQPIEEPENHEHMLHIFDMIQAERTVMFATDYPHWDFDNPVMALPPMSRKLKRCIMGETAARVFGLPFIGADGMDEDAAGRDDMEGQQRQDEGGIGMERS